MRFNFLFLICLFWACACFAQTHKDEFGIQTDNDSYLANGSDRYYTNGLFFYYRHALPIKTDSSKLQNKVLGFELGQKIFNPQSGVIPEAIYVDRPFAGYLYIASSLNLLYKDESNIKLTAQLGIVGPASLGKAAQLLIHNTFGLYKIVGWQFQITNDPELDLSFEYNRLLAREGAFDVSLASYVNLGTGFTGAGAGPLFRLGAFNQLFNSESTQSSVIANRKFTPLHKNEFFLYYKPQFNVVAYDATIQGSLFESHQNDYFSGSGGEITGTPEPLLFSQQIGAALTAERWTIDASAIFHTKDTKQMIQSHQWGSVTALYRFH